MGKERIHWIDIAKGLMIIGMILNHIPNYSLRGGGMILDFPWSILGAVYGRFTMQAFFILSGITMGLNNNFQTFIVKQIKSLLIPYMSFTIICKIIEILFFDEGLFVTIGSERFHFIMEGYWFLSSLFIGKMIVYLLNKISSNQYFVFIALLIIMFIGFAVTEYYSDKPDLGHYHNYFHYRNGLCMAIFLYIGYKLKKYSFGDKYFLFAGLLYLVTYTISYIMQFLDFNVTYLSAPSYSHSLVLMDGVNAIGLMPAYLFYCITGSCLIIWIAKKINRCNLFEILGKRTLVIYCIHFTILKFSIDVISGIFLPDSFYTSITYFIVVGLTTITLSSLCAKYCENKPFNYLLGKF